MLINIHELSSLASILKITGLLSTVSSKLESAIVKEHRRASLCCIIVIYKHMIGYWFSVKGCRLDRILSSQQIQATKYYKSLSLFSFSCFCGERDLLQVHNSPVLNRSFLQVEIGDFLQKAPFENLQKRAKTASKISLCSPS